MRPKKRILLIDNSAKRRSVTRFVLKIWGYSIVSSPTLELIAKTEREAIGPIDLVVGLDTPKDRSLTEIAASFSCPTLVVLTKAQRREDSFAEETLIKPTMEQFRDAVRRRSIRKRGPRKGVIYPKGVKKQPARVGLEAIAA